MSDNPSISVTYTKFYVITYYVNNHELQSGDNEQECIKTDLNGINFDIPLENNYIPGIIYIIALDESKYISVSNYVLHIEDNEVCSTLITSFNIPIMLKEVIIGFFDAQMFEIRNVDPQSQTIETLQDHDQEYSEWEEYTGHKVVPHIGFAYAGLVYYFKEFYASYAIDDLSFRIIDMDPAEAVDCISIAFSKMIGSDYVSNFAYTDGELVVKPFLFPRDEDVKSIIEEIRISTHWDQIDVSKMEKFTNFKTHINVNIDSSLNRMIANVYDTNVKKQLGFVFGRGHITETTQTEKLTKLGKFESTVVVERDPKRPDIGLNDNPKATLCVTARSFVAIASLRSVLAYHAIKKQENVDKEKAETMKNVNKKNEAKEKVPGSTRLLKWVTHTD